MASSRRDMHRGIHYHPINIYILIYNRDYAELQPWPPRGMDRFNTTQSLTYHSDPKKNDSTPCSVVAGTNITSRAERKKKNTRCWKKA
ncbi:hypothetical protein M413DRAFT_282934 [Hebeloma cylindrosporum]|uniref:Uncharacterized protein n=1 Tax=Hebeloma cylindrosporum TaxID=76867 RepID=A0A0C2Y7F8_HEBCY|nr:hypothetical protein M413DRAFT_282934 [Hebeloma cylindrosporum h7]